MNALQYQILTEKGLDKDVIQVLEETFQSREERLATKDDIELTKLTLQKEIEEVRREIKEVKLTLQKEIEEVKLTLQKEIEEVKGTLQKEIEEVRREIKEVELTLQKEIEEVRREIKEVELRLTQEIHRSNLKNDMDNDRSIVAHLRGDTLFSAQSICFISSHPCKSLYTAIY